MFLHQNHIQHIYHCRSQFRWLEFRCCHRHSHYEHHHIFQSPMDIHLSLHHYSRFVKGEIRKRTSCEDLDLWRIALPTSGSFDRCTRCRRIRQQSTSNRTIFIRTNTGLCWCCSISQNSFRILYIM